MLNLNIKDIPYDLCADATAFADNNNSEEATDNNISIQASELYDKCITLLEQGVFPCSLATEEYNPGVINLICQKLTTAGYVCEKLSDEIIIENPFVETPRSDRSVDIEFYRVVNVVVVRTHGITNSQRRFEIIDSLFSKFGPCDVNCCYGNEYTIKYTDTADFVDATESPDTSENNILDLLTQ